MKAIAAVLVVALSTACGSARVLDEARARTLIEEGLRAESFLTSITHITPLMTRSSNNYLDAKAGTATGPAFRLRQLVEQGLVRQSAESVSYPDVSGTWIYQNEYTRGYNTYSDNFTIQLRMVGKSNSVTGTCRTLRTSRGLGSTRDQNSGPVTGTVTSEGVVALNGYRFCFGNQQPVSYRYREEGSVAYLQPFNSEDRTYRGDASRRRVEVTWYKYEFSPEVRRSDSRGREAQVSAGTFDVGVVTNLQLVGETNAAANFAWTVSLNKIGLTLLGDVRPSGTGVARFVKKPDGTWVLAERPVP